jgi:hypothetical protein
MKLKIGFKFNFITTALAAVTLVACAGGSARLPVAGETDLARGAMHYPDLTSAELTEGRTLFAGHCGACHLPPTPASLHASDWPGHITEMKLRARLDDRQARLVERYLVTMAR